MILIEPRHLPLDKLSQLRRDRKALALDVEGNPTGISIGSLHVRLSLGEGVWGAQFSLVGKARTDNAAMRAPQAQGAACCHPPGQRPRAPQADPLRVLPLHSQFATAAAGARPRRG